MGNDSAADDGLLLSALGALAAVCVLRALIVDDAMLAVVTEPFYVAGSLVGVASLVRAAVRSSGRDRVAWSVIVAGGGLGFAISALGRVSSQPGKLAIMLLIASSVAAGLAIGRSATWSRVTMVRNAADAAWMVAGSAPAWWAVAVEPVWNQRGELGLVTTGLLLTLCAVALLVAADVLATAARFTGSARVPAYCLAVMSAAYVLAAQAIVRADPALIASGRSVVGPLLACVPVLGAVAIRHPQIGAGVVAVEDVGERWFWVITLAPLVAAVPVTLAAGEVSPSWPVVAMPLLAWRAGLVVRENAELLAAEGRRVMSDPLTGLANRRALSSLGSSGAGGVRGVCFVDLDGFKPVNDDLGHEAGDAVLVAVARRLERCVRVQDTVLRLGGDEFVAVLAGPVDQATLDEVACRMLDAVAEPIGVAGTQVQLSASVGTASSADETLAVLLARADAAMYDAKRDGGGRVALAV